MTFTREQTPQSTAAIELDFPDFIDHVRERLEAGRAQYGDSSFSMDPLRLVAELQAEALDLAGWGFILWSRLRSMHEELSLRGVCPTPCCEACPAAENPAHPSKTVCS